MFASAFPSFPLIALAQSQTQALLYHLPLIAPTLSSIYHLFHLYILLIRLFLYISRPPTLFVVLLPILDILKPGAAQQPLR
jgi:hypothetical protein